MFSVIFINDLRYVEKVVVGRIGNIVDGRGVKSANVVGYARMWRAQRCTQGPVELGVVKQLFLSRQNVHSAKSEFGKWMFLLIRM